MTTPQRVLYLDLRLKGQRALVHPDAASLPYLKDGMRGSHDLTSC